MSDTPTSYTPEPFQPFSPYDRQISNELLKANENFKILAQAFKNNDPSTLELNYSVYAYNSTISYNFEVLSPLQIPYSRLFIQTTPPQNPQLFDSWFNNDPLTNSLSYYNGEKWINVDYLKSLVFGSYETTLDTTYFYSMGRMVEVMADDGNPADDFKIIRLMPGQSLVMRNKSKIRVYAPLGSSYQCNAVFPTSVVGVLPIGAVGIRPDIDGYLPNTGVEFYAYGTSFTSTGEFLLDKYTNPNFLDGSLKEFATTDTSNVEIPNVGYLPVAYYPLLLHYEYRLLFCEFTLNIGSGYMSSFGVSGAINSATFTNGILMYNPDNQMKSLGTFRADGLDNPFSIEHAVITRIR